MEIESPAALQEVMIKTEDIKEETYDEGEFTFDESLASRSVDVKEEPFITDNEVKDEPLYLYHDVKVETELLMHEDILENDWEIDNQNDKESPNNSNYGQRTDFSLSDHSYCSSREIQLPVEEDMCSSDRISISKFLGHGRAKLLNSWIGRATVKGLVKKMTLTSLLSTNFSNRKFHSIWFKGHIQNVDLVESHDLVVVCFRNSASISEVERIFSNRLTWEKLDPASSLPSCQKLYLRTLVRTAGSCAFSRPQMIDLKARARLTNQVNTETSTVWLGLFIFKAGRVVTRSSLDMINFTDTDFSLFEEVGLYNLPKVGDAKVGILVKTSQPVTKSYLESVFLKFMDFVARVNTNILWQKHRNRYEKELLYFVDSGEFKIMDILSELVSKQEKSKARLPQDLNFPLLDLLSDPSNPRILSEPPLPLGWRFQNKGGLPLVGMKQEKEEYFRFNASYWVGLVPKELDLKLCLVEKSKMDRLIMEVGVMEGRDKVFIVDPLKVDFLSDIQPNLSSKISWFRVPVENMESMNIHRLGRISVGKSNTDRISVGKSSTDRISVGKSNTDRISVGKSNTDRISVGKSKTDKICGGKSKTDKICVGKSKTDKICVGKSKTDRICMGKSKTNLSIKERKDVRQQDQEDDVLDENQEILSTVDTGISCDGETRSKAWLLIFESSEESKKVNMTNLMSGLRGRNQLLGTRLCQLEDARIFNEVEFAQVRNRVGAEVIPEVPDSAVDIRIVRLSFLHPVRLQDLTTGGGCNRVLPSFIKHWVPDPQPDPFLGREERNLLVEWGIFSDLETYLLFRLEGKTADFFVRKKEGDLVLSVSRDKFLMNRFDDNLRDLHGHVSHETVQLSKSRTERTSFSNIPLGRLNKVRSVANRLTIQEFATRMINKSIKSNEEEYSWNYFGIVRLTAMVNTL